MGRCIVGSALLALVATGAHPAPAVSDAQLVLYAMRAAERPDRPPPPGVKDDGWKVVELRRCRGLEALAYFDAMPAPELRGRLVPLLERLTPDQPPSMSVAYVLAQEGVDTGRNVQRMFHFLGERPAPLSDWEKGVVKAFGEWTWDVDMLPFRLRDIYRRTHDPAVLREALSPPILDGSYGEEWPYVVLQLALRDPKGMLNAASGSHLLTERLARFLFMCDVPREDREKMASILRVYAHGANTGLAAVARACLKKKPILEAPGRMFGPPVAKPGH